MRRRRLDVLAISSLVVAAVLIVLWARSGRLVDDHVIWRGRTTWLAQSRDGRLWLERWIGADPVPIPPTGTDLSWQLRGTSNSAAPGTPIQTGYSPPLFSDSYGFHWQQFDLAWPTAGQSLGAEQLLAVPYWASTAFALIVPTIWVVLRFCDRRRRGINACRSCGYDLRASAERCPECGTSIG